MNRTLCVFVAALHEHMFTINSVQKKLSGELANANSRAGPYQVRATDVMASVQFYESIFGLKYKAGPVVMGHQGHWLYDSSGNAIIHFREIPASSHATGPIDHIALKCDGKADVIGRLEEFDIKFQIAEGLITGVPQLFVTAPHGVPLEIQLQDEIH